MTDEFDRKWVEILTRFTWIKAVYGLIGLTRLGERPTTVDRLAAVLERPEVETIELAWEASRVRPDEQGRLHLAAPFGGGGPSRRNVYVGGRQIPVSGCGPDLFPAAAVLDVPFRVEDSCSATGAPIRIDFSPEGVQRVDPPGVVVAMVAPEVASEYGQAEIEQINLELCSQQPFFASPRAARQWLADHPGGRLVPVREVTHMAFFTHIRDTWRPRILANMP